MSNNHQILVGKIVAPQGIRGDVRVQTFSESPMDFQKFKVHPSVRGTAATWGEKDFRFVRVVPNSSVIIAHIAGFDDRNAAETLRGTELYIERDTLPALQQDEYYQSDLIGFSVIRDGKKIGTVAGFQNFGAGDIIELDNGDYVSFVGADVDMTKSEIKL